MYSKSSLKLKQYAINVVTGDLFQNYVIGPSQKLIQMKLLMNRLYLLIWKELQLNELGFSQGCQKNIASLDNFSSTRSSGQSTVASGTDTYIVYTEVTLKVRMMLELGMIR